MATPPARPRRAAAPALALAALVLLPAAASAAPGSPGRLAEITVSNGSDHQLQIWRDDATGEIGLYDPEEVQIAVRLQGNTLRYTEGEDEALTAGFPSRARLSAALEQLDAVGAGLDRIEEALAAGTAAPEPSWLARARYDELVADRTTGVVDFARGVRAMARAVGRPVAWLGSRAGNVPLHSAQVITARERSRPGQGPFPVVVYAAAPAVPIVGAVYVHLGEAGGPVVRVFTDLARAARNRAIVAGLRPDRRFGGRPARVTSSTTVIVRVGPQLVTLVSGLRPPRLPQLVRSLRFARP